jgi:hypothetical protein
VEQVGTVREIWRYPVKSMAGEQVEALDVGVRGLRGDRLWAVRDEQKGVLTNGKKLPALMLLRARYVAEPPVDATPVDVPAVTIEFPDGSQVRSGDPAVHERLSAFLDRRVTLWALRPASDHDHYRAAKPTRSDLRKEFAVEPGDPLPDFSMLPLSVLAELGRFATPRGTHFDAYTLHLVSSATLAALRDAAPSVDFDARRFRPNFVLDTGASGVVDPGWCGGTLRVGGLVTHVDVPTVRCSMVTRPQPGLEPDPAVLKEIVARTERCLGVYATVATPGRVRVGDAVELEPARTSALSRAFDSGAKRLKSLALRAVAKGIAER